MKIKNGYRSWKQDLKRDWLESDPGSGIWGIHLECKRILGSRSDAKPDSDCIQSEADQTQSEP